MKQELAIVVWLFWIKGVKVKPGLVSPLKPVNKH